MRNAIMVLSWVFLVLLVLNTLIEYGISFADDAATFISIGKDLCGFALAVTVLLYLRGARDKVGPAT